MANTVYDLKVNESMIVKDNDVTIRVVTRVPGGWLYDLLILNSHETEMISCSSVFVPFNSEFQHMPKSADVDTKQMGLPL